MRTLISFLSLVLCTTVYAQPKNAVMEQVRKKLSLVRDYEASATLSTDIPFLKAPAGDVTVWYKAPNLFKLQKKEGIAFLPKGGLNMNLQQFLLSGNYTVVPAGTATLNGKLMEVMKLLPNQQEEGIVLTTLWVDAKQALVYKAQTTTLQNGSYDVLFQYGAYAKYALPSTVSFSFDVKDFKLPKGVTLEYEGAAKTTPKAGGGKGKVVLTYKQYQVNKGLSNAIFK